MEPKDDLQILILSL